MVTTETEKFGQDFLSESRDLSPLERLQALRRLPAEERDRLLYEASLALAPLYNEDLAKPPHERELTAFTALDGV